MTVGRLGKRRGIVLAALVAAAGATAFALLLTHRGGPATAGAADHLDAPGLTSPPGGDGIGTDITDIYAFQSPSRPGNTVLIMNVNGLTTADLANPPGPDRPFAQTIPLVKINQPVYYYFRIDSNGDAVADTNIQVAFGKPNGSGAQDMRVKIIGGKEVELEGRSTGFGKDAVVNHGPMGIKAFAGRRDDPFFFDLVGFLNLFDLGGRSFVGCGGPSDHPENNTFTGQNVSSIVLELPSKLLEGGGDSAIGVWATTNVSTTQIDRMGRPAINTVFIPNNPIPPDNSGPSQKTTFNHGQPSTDVATWTPEVVNSLQTLFSLNDPGSGLGGNDDPSDDPAQINALAGFLLPDILTVDVSSAAGFPNGRRPADDVIDTELGLITESFVTTDCVANDNDLLAAFPYLGNPN